MSEIIARDTQELNQDARVDLFELDLRRFGEGVERFAPGPINREPIEFNGYKYYSVPVTAEGFKWDGQGTLPSPTLTLSMMSPTLSSLIREHDDLVGIPVRRIRTYRRYLDDGDSPNPEARFPNEEFVIERKTSQNSVQVEFELSVKFDQRGKKIPGRQVIRDTCTHRYRKWNGSEFDYENATCPYDGDDYFDAAGNSVGSGSSDRCGKRLSDCEKRHGNKPLPFYGFPGAGRL